MPNKRALIAGGIIIVLIFGNLISYLCSGWGLITVKVKDVPLRKVIKSIEWQGWVTIYSNIDPDTKVSMWVDHVPLAEAMDTLALNVEGNKAGGGPDNGQGGRGPGGAGDNAAPPPGGPGNVAGGPPPGAPPPDGNRPDGGRRGGRGGGFGRGAQWSLAFFVGPTSADVKEEIRSFQEGGSNDNAKIFHYATPIQQMLVGDYDLPSADPRLQNWPGVKAEPAPEPAPDPNAQPADNATPPPAIDPTSLQAYLQDFAKGADVWIMAPTEWNPNVSTPPAPDSSIIRAVKNLVGHAHGSVTQALVLHTGRGGGGGMRGFAGNDDTGWSEMNDRLRNAINGLPEDARANALHQLDQEDRFRKDLMIAPQEQRQQMMRQHMADKMLDGDNWKKMTPEKRAQRYQRMVSAHAAATGR